MDTRTFSADQKLKLTQLINEGMQVMQEIETYSNKTERLCNSQQIKFGD